jgi:TolA-binding protein
MRKWTIATVSLFFMFLVVFPSIAQESGGGNELYQRASSAFQRGNYSRSLELYQRFTNQYPNHSQFWDAKFGIAQSHFKLNHFRKANRMFSSVRKNHSNQTIRGDALFGQIQVAILEDNVALARALSNTFLDIHDEHILRSSVKRQLEMLEDMTPSEDRGPSDTTIPRSTEDDSPEEEERGPVTEGVTQTGDSPASAPPGDEDSDGPSDETETEPTSTPSGVMPELRFGSEATSTDTEETGEDRSRQEATETRSTDEGDNETSRSAELVRDLRNKLDEKDDQLEDLRNRVQQLSQQNDRLDSRVRTLKQRNQRLEQKLAQGVASLVEDTGLQQLMGSIDLPDTATRAIESSLSELRRQTRSALESGRLDRAERLVERILNRAPSAGDYYLAARIHQRRNQPGEAIADLREAIERADSAPVKYLADQATLLSEQGRENRLNELIDRHHPRVRSQPESESRAQWFYVLGRRDHRHNRPDRAFFHLMEVIRTAPESEWARRARSLIQNEL